MKQVNVGILGATGAVGQEMIKILEERNFPVASLRPIASARSAGSKIMFRGQECTIVEASDDAFEGLDIVLGAAENDIAERFAPSIVKAGAVFVDNSSAFRLDPNVPLVIPEINPEDVKWHKGIISNPNCTTIVTLVAINALAKESPIETIIASSYQAVSGAGKGGIDELNNEVKALSEGKHLEPKVFQYQIAYNIIPQIGGEAFEGYTSEEMKMQNVQCMEYEICIVLLLCHTDQYRNFHRTFLSAETAKYPGRIYPGFLPEQRCDPWNCNYPESLRKRRNGTTYDHRKCASL